MQVPQSAVHAISSCSVYRPGRQYSFVKDTLFLSFFTYYYILYSTEHIGQSRRFHVCWQRDTFLVLKQGSPTLWACRTLESLMIHWCHLKMDSKIQNRRFWPGWFVQDHAVRDEARTSKDSPLWKHSWFNEIASIWKQWPELRVANYVYKGAFMSPSSSHRNQ